MALNPERLLRLYPRRWRERYGEELCVLLEDTSITPLVVADLLVGAMREWVRALTVDPGPAEDRAREAWRNVVRTSVATLAMAGTTWASARLVMRAGLTTSYATDVLMVPYLVLLFLSFRGMGRRSKFKFASKDENEAENPGIGRREFWITLVVFGVGLIAWWMNELTSDHSYDPISQLRPYLHLFLLYQQLSILRSRTKTHLARARQINLIDTARHRALLPPSPWS